MLTGELGNEQPRGPLAAAKLDIVGKPALNLIEYRAKLGRIRINWRVEVRQALSDSLPQTRPHLLHSQNHVE